MPNIKILKLMFLWYIFRNKINYFCFVFFLCAAVFIISCGDNRNTPHGKVPDVKPNADPWLNHNDSVHYAGINTCKQCHMEIYQTFIKTGMGQSFDSASRSKSAGKFNSHTVIYDKENNFYYHPFWEGEKYFIREFRLENGDTIFNRKEQVNFIVGSGQHTNSHIFNTNGYLHQMPLTFYAQKGKWDLPPGFENGANTRFSRKIGLECMSCHNAYPDFVEGSENKYNRVMNGIDCERCHGPGSAHVALKQQGERIDTSKSIDYSIVNPGKLTVDRQFDVCMRCHLQGNAILKPGKSFYDFRPGMTLSDFITVFMPKYEGADDEFIMASHAARLKMSKCFIESAKSKSSTDNLRPYKNALTCVTCHNPHVSVRETQTKKFNSACMNCHASEKNAKICTDTKSNRNKVGDNCTSCHMPRSGSTDIPHVSVHDHYIRRPRAKADVKALKKFIGLYAVNDDHPIPATKAKAYLNYYEKFDAKNSALLDSALKFIPSTGLSDLQNGSSSLVQAYFLKRNFSEIENLVNKVGKNWLLKINLIHVGLSNDDAWTAYRVGEAYYALNKKQDAADFYGKAAALAPFNLDFQSKLGITLLDLNKKEESAKVFDYILREDDKYASAYTNRGRIYFYDGNFQKALECYDKALQLDPDMIQAMKNKVDIYNEQKDYASAKKLLQKILSIKPGDKDAKLLLERMKKMKLIS